MSEVMIKCKKCQAFVWHKVLPDRTARCINCGDEVDLDDPKIVIAEVATKGK